MLLIRCSFLSFRSSCSRITMSASRATSKIFMPPVDVCGMTEFDASKFSKTVRIPYITVPSKIIGRIVGSKAIQNYRLKRNQKFGSIMNGKDEETKLMLFDPDEISNNENADRLIQETVKKIADTDVAFEYKEVTLNYEDWDVRRCIRAILPSNLDFSGHAQAGHILHLNLREELMPYRFVIGKILLDKIGYARTVVNKLDQISSEFRLFEFELLAGEPDYIATISENGFKFKLDFSKVFWNSKLGGEHERIVKEIWMQRKNTVVFDVFAGVGPFVIPAVFLKNTIKAYANDLNPTSVEYMNESLKLNKAPVDKYAVYNMDGTEFIKTVLPIAYREHCLMSTDPVVFHILMNLPAVAVTFLTAFESVLARIPNISKETNKCDFIVHCYMFVKAAEEYPESWFEEQAVKAVKEQVSSEDVEIIKVTYVRNVASRKNMYCVTFKLSFCYLIRDQDYNVVPEKRQKVEET